MHILVNLSTIDPDIPHDSTCEFKGGEHGFIKKASYAVYDFAIQRHKNFIDGKASKGIYKKHKHVNPAVVAKIAAGVKQSPDTTSITV